MISNKAALQCFEKQLSSICGKNISKYDRKTTGTCFDEMSMIRKTIER